MKKWWKWAYWVSPMMYGQNALAVNEFRGSSWNQVVSKTSTNVYFKTYTDVYFKIFYFLVKVVLSTGETLGVLILKVHGFLPSEDWYWIGVGAIIGFSLLFNFGYVLALTYLNRE